MLGLASQTFLRGAKAEPLLSSSMSRICRVAAPAWLARLLLAFAMLVVLAGQGVVSVAAQEWASPKTRQLLQSPMGKNIAALFRMKIRSVAELKRAQRKLKRAAELKRQILEEIKRQGGPDAVSAECRMDICAMLVGVTRESAGIPELLDAIWQKVRHNVDVYERKVLPASEQAINDFDDALRKTEAPYKLNQALLYLANVALLSPDVLSGELLKEARAGGEIARQVAVGELMSGLPKSLTGFATGTAYYALTNQKELSELFASGHSLQARANIMGSVLAAGLMEIAESYGDELRERYKNAKKDFIDQKKRHLVHRATLGILKDMISEYEDAMGDINGERKKFDKLNYGFHLAIGCDPGGPFAPTSYPKKKFGESVVGMPEKEFKDLNDKLSKILKKLEDTLNKLRSGQCRKKEKDLSSEHKTVVIERKDDCVKIVVTLPMWRPVPEEEPEKKRPPKAPPERPGVPSVPEKVDEPPSRPPSPPFTPDRPRTVERPVPETTEPPKEPEELIKAKARVVVIVLKNGTTGEPVEGARIKLVGKVPPLPRVASGGDAAKGANAERKPEKERGARRAERNDIIDIVRPPFVETPFITKLDDYDPNWRDDPYFAGVVGDTTSPDGKAELDALDVIPSPLRPEKAAGKRAITPADRVTLPLSLDPPPVHVGLASGFDPKRKTFRQAADDLVKVLRPRAVPGSVRIIPRALRAPDGTPMVVARLSVPRKKAKNLAQWVKGKPQIKVFIRDDCFDKEAKRGAASRPAPRWNDPYYSGRGLWGQSFPDQWALRSVGFHDGPDSAWRFDGGKGARTVVLAIIDTGIDWLHPDLDPAVLWRNPDEIADNGKDDDGNGYIDDVIGWNFVDDDARPWDDDGHGTFIAGIIAAKRGNAYGIAGIDDRHIRIMPLKALGPFGRGLGFHIAQAIVYAVDNGADVINLSLGARTVNPIVRMALEDARRKGVVVVAAAGNEAGRVRNFLPSGASSVITVAATDRGRKRVGFSNWGRGVDIAAPGMSVLSLRARNTDLLAFIPGVRYRRGKGIVGENRAFYRASGTSFAAPFVSGTIAYVLAHRPQVTRAQAVRMVLQSARDIETPGIDNYTGYGLLDAAAAVRADPAFFVDARIEGVRLVRRKGRMFLQVLGTAAANRLKEARLYLGIGAHPKRWLGLKRALKKARRQAPLFDVPVRILQRARRWTLRLVVVHRNGRKRESRYALNLR